MGIPKIITYNIHTIGTEFASTSKKPLFAMNIIWSVIIGLVAGWITNMIVRGRNYGLIVNLVVGVIGSLVGLWSANWFSFMPVSFFGASIASVIGAVILLCIVSIITKSRREQNY